MIPDLSFGHNLCFKCLNGSCELILDIYIPRAFQWYKKLFNLMGSTPAISFWIFRSPTHKVGVHLRVWGFIPSHSPTLSGAWNVTLRLHTWPAPLQALALVASPRLGLRQHICVPITHNKLFFLPNHKNVLMIFLMFVHYQHHHICVSIHA